jgi:PAS domain S-box-containing protein
MPGAGAPVVEQGPSQRAEAGRAKGMALLSPPQGALARTRWLFLLLALAGTALLASLLVLNAPTDWLLKVAAWAALGWLCCRWIYMYQGARLSLAWDVLEGLAFVLVGVTVFFPVGMVAPAITGLCFRALYGTRGRVLFVALVYSSAFCAALALSPRTALVPLAPAQIGVIVGLIVLLGSVVQLVGTALTKYEQAQAEIAELNAALDRRVRERTTELEAANQALIQEIDGRRRAEDTLRQSEERYRSVVDTSPDGIVLSDLQPSFLMCNQQALVLFGYERPDEVLGRSVFEFIAPEEHARAIATIQQILDQGSVKEIEYTLMKKDGTRFSAEVSASAIRDASGQPAALMAIVRDITERKRAEDNARRLLHEQAERARLEESTHALAEANRAKSEFLAAMSHELRTPLNSIIGFSELLMDETGNELLPTERRRFASNIHGSGQHLLRLVNDILDLAKVEAGRMELHPTTFEVAESLLSVDAALRPLAEQKGLTLLTHVAPAVTTLHADEGRFKQVLYNLLSNAVKFTPEGGRVETSARLADGALEVVVTDTGVGIAASDQERIFHAFQQLDGSPSRQHEGTGLGLGLARQMVELMGGRLWVESALGQGSRFGFTVPLYP